MKRNKFLLLLFFLEIHALCSNEFTFVIYLFIDLFVKSPSDDSIWVVCIRAKILIQANVDYVCIVISMNLLCRLQCYEIIYESLALLLVRQVAESFRRIGCGWFFFKLQHCLVADFFELKNVQFNKIPKLCQYLNF